MKKQTILFVGAGITFFGLVSAVVVLTMDRIKEAEAAPVVESVPEVLAAVPEPAPAVTPPAPPPVKPLERAELLKLKDLELQVNSALNTYRTKVLAWEKKRDTELKVYEDELGVEVKKRDDFLARVARDRDLKPECHRRQQVDPANRPGCPVIWDVQPDGSVLIGTLQIKE